MIQAKLQRDDLPEEEWKKMNDEIEECKRLAWKIKPLSRRKVLARLEMINNGAEPGRLRTRNSHLKALQYVPEGLTSFVNWAQVWMMGLANKDETLIVATCRHCSVHKRGGQPGTDQRGQNYDR